VIYTVKQTVEAEADLLRLFEFVLQRELDADGDPELAARAVGAIREGFKLLERFPFTCRKAADNPFLRELLIPFGHTGCVALFEVVDDVTVVVAAVRHQREDDYH
jgi:plasmid stabilization system protein ParE